MQCNFFMFEVINIVVILHKKKIRRNFTTNFKVSEEAVKPINLLSFCSACII